MEKSNKIAQIYGYSVCLVAIIAFLFSFPSFVDAIFDLADPQHSRNVFWRPELRSYEALRAERPGPVRSGTVSGRFVSPDTALDAEALQAMREEAEQDQIRSVRGQAYRALTVKGLLMVICVVLFVTHWRWLKRQTAQT